MTKRRAFWSLAVLFLVAALAALIPSSPVYAPKLFARYANVYDGHGPGYWTDALNDPDPEVRNRAIFALGAMGEGAGDSVPALAAIMVNDADDAARVQASLAISKMGTAARKAIPSLAQALGDKHALVRLNAARTLGNMGAEAREAVPGLINATKGEDNQAVVPPFSASVCDVASVALGRITAGTEDGVPALLEALEAAKMKRTKEAVARALGEVGPSARAAVPQLKALLDDGDPELQGIVAGALKKINETPPG